MSSMEKVVVTGNVDDRFILLFFEFNDLDEYKIKKVLYFSELEEMAIHSMLFLDNIIYIADSFNNKIYKYDLELNNYDEITVGRDPRHMCISNENMYLTNFESDNISVIDTKKFTLTGSIPAGIKPHDIIWDEKSNYLYISCYEENQILEYNLLNENKKYYSTNGKPMHIFIEENNLIAMTYFTNGNIYTKINFINLQTGEIEDIIKIKGLASNIEYNNINKCLYLINIDDKNLYLIDVNKRGILKKIYIGGYPEGISFSKRNIYVTNSKKNQITVIDIKNLEFKKNIDLQFSPICIKTIK